MVPYLAAEIPTLENGGVAEDLKSITWKLKDGLIWSDGTPVTAEDAVFTWQYCTHPEGGCAQPPNFGDVDQRRGGRPADDQGHLRRRRSPIPTARSSARSRRSSRRRSSPTASAPRRPTCTEANTKPIGTGPFMVDRLQGQRRGAARGQPELPRSGEARLRQRGAQGRRRRRPRRRARCSRPASSTMPGTPRSSPRSSRRWQAAGKGEVISAFGTLVERIHVNQTDPDPALGDDALDRGASAPVPDRPERGQGAQPRHRPRDPGRDRLRRRRAGRPATWCRRPRSTPRPNNDWCKTQDIDEANKLLDEAGWVMGGDGVREKDGVRLSHPLPDLDQLGAPGGAGADQAVVERDRRRGRAPQHRRRACSSAATRARPTRCRSSTPTSRCTPTTSTAPTRRSISATGSATRSRSPENQWQGGNISRFCTAEYDALHAKMGETAGAEERGEDRDRAQRHDRELDLVSSR